MNHRNNPGVLSLRQQFASATLALATGIAAAYGVHEAVSPIFDHIAQMPVFTFLATYGTLFAVTGSAAGYADETVRQANMAKARLSPWGVKPGFWN